MSASKFFTKESEYLIAKDGVFKALSLKKLQLTQRINVFL
tara:strand:- start:645 stop:764 length:120 start_codon:yes stop_codon:yes gene_type:complete